MHEWPLAVLSNPLDKDPWQPIDQPLPRQLMSLPQDCPLLLFSSMGGGNDPRKEIDLLLAVLAYLRSEPSLQSL